MRIVFRSTPIVLLLPLLAGCTWFKVLTYEEDREASGYTRDETVQIVYFNSRREETSSIVSAADDDGSKGAIDLLFDKRASFGACGPPEDEDTGAPKTMFLTGVALPFVAAIGKAGFDLLEDAIGAQGAALAKRAKGPWSATLYSEVLEFGAVENLAFKKGDDKTPRYIADSGAPDCIGVIRMAKPAAKPKQGEEDKAVVAAIIVFHLQPYVAGKNTAAAGYVFQPVYLWIPKPKAVVQQPETGKTASLSVTAGLSIAAIQPSPENSAIYTPRTVMSAEYKFGKIEVGKTYCTAVDKSIGCDKELKAQTPGLFAGLAVQPAVGTIAISVAEAGAAAAGFGEQGAFEKAVIKATKDAYGKLIDSAISSE